MSYIIIAIIVLSIILIINKFEFHNFPFKRSHKLQNNEILKVLLNLNQESLDRLFKYYKENFGDGAANYAKKTYQKWKEGKVKPNRQTFERFLIHLPKVISYDLKCEVLRLFMKEFCPKENYETTVYTDNWEEILTPLVQKMIDKPYSADLPLEVQKKLTWLADGEMQAAKEILRQSHFEEGKIAVSQLRQEFKNLEIVLAETHLKPKVTHQLKFTYGTITLNIKRRK
ncbi:MAG: hypothetical protein K1X72_14380 [Pyrinomonadaceae bacterium]|nr:hypothetical protein [Pyrinomonadaceae bacterium]